MYILICWNPLSSKSLINCLSYLMQTNYSLKSPFVCVTPAWIYSQTKPTFSNINNYKLKQPRNKYKNVNICFTSFLFPDYYRTLQQRSFQKCIDCKTTSLWQRYIPFSGHNYNVFEPVCRYYIGTIFILFRN